MQFLNKEHQKRFSELLNKDNTNPKDIERQALFYLFAGNSDLFRKVNSLYNFEGNFIVPDADVDLSSGIRALAELGFNLYNGYGEKTVMDTFAGLDEQNFELAINAIRLRFNR